MFDISWISEQAKTIHEIFVGLFYAAASLLLLIGVLLEYFKWPLGGMPSFSILLGRTVIAALLLVTYPEIANMVASVTDQLADKVGALNTFDEVKKAIWKVTSEHRFSWTSIPDGLLFLVAYLIYWLLHFSVVFYDAAIIYTWALLYVFSPILTVLFILPVTSGATRGLFRSLFIVGTWKVVWSVLGTLLWSAALNNLNQSGEHINIITMLSLCLMLVLSMILTPMVVSSILSGGGISNMANKLLGTSVVALSAGFMGPATATKVAGAPARGLKNLGRKGYTSVSSSIKKLREEKESPILNQKK